MVYWKSNHFWLGKLIEHPEIITKGETLKIGGKSERCLNSYNDEGCVNIY